VADPPREEMVWGAAPHPGRVADPPREEMVWGAAPHPDAALSLHGELRKWYSLRRRSIKGKSGENQCATRPTLRSAAERAEGEGQER